MGRLKIGVMCALTASPEEGFRSVRGFGLGCCQLLNWNPGLYADALAERVVEAAERQGVEITTLWAGYSGAAVWNFVEGPATIGLVPAGTRERRVRELMAASDWAKKIGVESITTHVGFLPEWAGDADYGGTIAALKRVVEHCAKNGQMFCFETGQETPITLLRAIEDIGAANVGINLDPANLLMYGKGNPVEALDIFGKWVRGVHAKDGEYPTEGKYLGHEKPLGEGRVNFPVLIAKLKSLGYAGALTIEREIGGEKQNEDIRRAIAVLEGLS